MLRIYLQEYWKFFTIHDMIENSKKGRVKKWISKKRFMQQQKNC